MRGDIYIDKPSFILPSYKTIKPPTLEFPCQIYQAQIPSTRTRMAFLSSPSWASSLAVSSGLALG
jgi:hypothetical protein